VPLSTSNKITKQKSKKYLYEEYLHEERIFTNAFKVRVALKSNSALVLGCERVLIVKFAKGGRSINLI